MSDVFLLALLSAVNPTLLAAVTVMLVLPSRKRLLVGTSSGPMWRASPSATDAVARFRSWLSRNAHALAVYASGIVGVALIGRGIIGLL